VVDRSQPQLALERTPGHLDPLQLLVAQREIGSACTRGTCRRRGARVSRFAFETMPASPTNTQGLNRQPLSSSFTLATAVTSAVLPGKIQCRTGKPSRVTASPITIYGTSLRPFLMCPRLRKACGGLAPGRDAAMHFVALSAGPPASTRTRPGRQARVPRLFRSANACFKRALKASSPLRIQARGS